MKRVELLMNQDNNQKETVKFQVKQDQLQLQRDLLETELALSQEEQKLKALKSAEVLSVASIITVMGNIASYKNGIEAIKELEKELF